MPKSKKPVFVNLQDGNVQVPREDGRMIAVSPWSERRLKKPQAIYEVEGEHFVRFVSAQGPLYPKPKEEAATFPQSRVATLQAPHTLQPVGTLKRPGDGPTLVPIPKDEDGEPADAAADTSGPGAPADGGASATGAPADPAAVDPADPFAGADDDADATANEDGAAPPADAPGTDEPRDNLALLPKVGEELAGALANAGFPTFKSIVDADVAALAAVHGISEKGAKALQKAAAKAEKAKGKSLKERARG